MSVPRFQDKHETSPFHVAAHWGQTLTRTKEKTVNKIRVPDLSGITGKLKGLILSSRVFPEELRTKLRPRASGGDERQL